MKNFLLLAAALLLVGCVSLLQSPSKSRVFNLQTPQGIPVATERLPIQLSIDEPAAGGALDSNRVVVYAQPLELQYLAGAQWSERATRLWQRLLVESIENSGRFRAVSSAGQALRHDWALVGELIEFQAQIDAGGAPTVLVKLSLKLVENPSLKVRSQRTFSARVAASGGDASAIVDGFDRATRQVLAEVVQWVGSEK